MTELQVRLKDAVDKLVSSFAGEFEEDIRKNVLEMSRLLQGVSKSHIPLIAELNKTYPIHWLLFNS